MVNGCDAEGVDEKILVLIINGWFPLYCFMLLKEEEKWAFFVQRVAYLGDLAVDAEQNRCEDRVEELAIGGNACDLCVVGGWWAVGEYSMQ